MSDETHLPPNIPPNFAALCACFNIRKAARAITSFYDSVLLQPTGLHSTQAILLVAIAGAGTPTISRLAEAMVMDRTTLARDLKPLAELGLVRITPGDDRRTRQVQVTDLGRAKVREIIPLWEQAQAKIIAHGLGHARWGKLYEDLQEVIRLAQA
jgi:DNA-binding MarR family transcriptional regulator